MVTWTQAETPANSAISAGWENVYMLVGGMSATLLGLLFVAVSLNLRVVMSDQHPDLRRDAIRTFNQFLLLIEVSISMVIPTQVPLTAGLTIAILGSVAWLLTALAVRGHPHTQGRRWSLVTPYLLFTGFIACGLLIVVVGANALFWLLALVIATLASSVFGSWALLVQVGRDE